MLKELIAPCGVNCAVCRAYLRPKNKCGGCLSESKYKPSHCDRCSIRFCSEHEQASFTYCHECGKFPCIRLEGLYKRYNEKYGLDLKGSLLEIKERGMELFIANEEKKWVCAGCGAVLCMHRAECLVCGMAYR